LREGDGVKAAGDGLLIVVVGASGVGKDSLINHARVRFAGRPGVTFVRRVVTRMAHAGAEEHDTLSAEAFAAAEEAGSFAATWQAHGLRYAIPGDVRQELARGGVAVVNGSRAALETIRDAFARVLVVHVTCDPATLSMRLASRGRESAAEQRQRLSRTVELRLPADAVEIDNSGPPEIAGEAFVGVIEQAMRHRDT